MNALTALRPYEPIACVAALKQASNDIDGVFKDAGLK
jgi:hypothetical protein